MIILKVSGVEREVMESMDEKGRIIASIKYVNYYPKLEKVQVISPGYYYEKKHKKKFS